MDTIFPIAVGAGAVPAVGVYALVSWVPAALGAGAVYAGAAYFYLAFDGSLLSAAPRFDDRGDRLGYAVGLFGLSVTPTLFAHEAGGGDATVFGFAIAFFGAVAFLTFSERARRRRDRTE